MVDDEGRIGRGETIEAEVCIVGSGPAGLVVAAALADRGHHVVLLESGARLMEATAQALNAGECEGDPYAGLMATRQRQLGGTMGAWNTPTPAGPGAKYTPLDPWDLTPRWAAAPAGWPISHTELSSYYERAQALCGLGAFAYDAASWSAPGRRPLRDAGGLTSRIYQFGSRDALMEPLRTAIERAPNARLLTHATVVQLAVRDTGVGLTVATATGGRFHVAAVRTVLAAGAVENARLLLVAQASGAGVEDVSGWLGRGFMEHPRDRTLTITPPARQAYRSLHFYDAHLSRHGGLLAGRLGLSADAMRDTAGTGGEPRLLNASATLLPQVRADVARARRVIGGLGLLRGLERYLPAGGYGWSNRRAPGFVYDGIEVLLNLEQPPRPENAILLGSRRDAHGVPLPVLRWRWHPEDHARLVRLRLVVARALEDAGVGRVRVSPDVPPDPNAHHHAGTTRMHPDPQHGVVDADGRVHGAPALFVVGASTFPTAGFANPTLTIVAMALRLADTLAQDGR